MFIGSTPYIGHRPGGRLAPKTTAKNKEAHKETIYNQ